MHCKRSGGYYSATGAVNPDGGRARNCSNADRTGRTRHIQEHQSEQVLLTSRIGFKHKSKQPSRRDSCLEAVSDWNAVFCPLIIGTLT